jgi:predicted Fe-Mo cluster-binding NifX family protein
MKKATVLMIFAICLTAVFAASAVSAQKGKIAVASDGKSDTAKVSAVAARSPFFLMFGQDGKFLEAIANPHKDAGGNASGLVTAFLSDKGVTDVIAGNFGDKMKNALKQKGIASFELKGSSAADAVKRYRMK